MNPSWKTTLCGILGALCVGLSQIHELAPLWVKICALLGATFPNVGLLFARDNRVTSEQACSKEKRKLAGVILPVLLVCGLLSFAGCAGTPQQTAVKTLGTIQTTTIGAYDGYLAGIVAGTVKTNDLPDISKKFNLFQASFLVALDGVQYNTNAIAPENLQVISTDLLNLLTKAEK